jgi:hypothetical protein
MRAMHNPRARCSDASVPRSEYHDRLREVRGRILSAARRGLGEAVISVSGPASEIEAIRSALGAEGFGVTSVTGEDGAYAVVFW